jgi:hypothetical protein
MLGLAFPYRRPDPMNRNSIRLINPNCEISKAMFGRIYQGRAMAQQEFGGGGLRL